MVFNFEYDMNREKDTYFKESNPVTIEKWYVLDKQPWCDGISIGLKGKEQKLNWEKHWGHFVQVIGYELPMRTDHFGLVKLYCKQCHKAFESVSTQLLREP